MSGLLVEVGSNSAADSARGKVDAWNGEYQAFQKAHVNFPMASRDTMVALIKGFLAK